MPPAARIGDMHLCPMVTGLVPHVGGPILPPCEPTVLTGFLPQARVGDMLVCAGGPDTIAKGSPTVLVGKSLAARIGDLTVHGGNIVLGCFTVMIGDAGAGGGGGGAPAPASAAPGPSAPPPPSKNVQIPPDMLAKSPTLARQLESLEKAGWKIQYWAGPGSDSNKSTKEIRIDETLRDDPKRLTQTVAHETGHALYTPNIDTSTRETYINSNLADEGAATMNNVLVQREIIANKGDDIGIAGNPANAAQYNALMDAYAKDGDAAKTREAIGQVYGKGERTSRDLKTYEDYYGSYYDANLARK